MAKKARRKIDDKYRVRTRRVRCGGDYYYTGDEISLGHLTEKERALLVDRNAVELVTETETEISKGATDGTND